MGRGQDIIASSLLDLQPTAVLEFFKIYPDTVNKPNFFISLHGGSIFKELVTWQGSVYRPIPVETEGFEVSANGQLPRPKIRIANEGYLITSLLQNNSDFKNAKIVRKRTFVKFLDDVNFDGGNPFGTADSSAEISSEDYLIGQKTAENKLYVEFELTSPLDLDNFDVNSRKILAKYCYWQYRGCGCNYNGTPIEQENGEAFKDADGNGVSFRNANNDSNNVSDININPQYKWDEKKSYVKGQLTYIENTKITLNYDPQTKTDPSYLKTWYVCVKDNLKQQPESNPTYWLKDGCTKKISACRKRFNGDQTVKTESTSVDVYDSYLKMNGLATDKTQRINKIGITGSAISEVLKGNFTLAGWTEDIAFQDYGGIFQTNSSGRHQGFSLYYYKKLSYIDYTFDCIDVVQNIPSIVPSPGLHFYTLAHRAGHSAPHNYLSYSKTFSNSYWKKNVDPSTSTSNITNTNTLAPNGLNEACLLSGNQGQNPGLSINNFTGNISTSASLYNPRPFAKDFTDYKQNLLFSIYVKPIDSLYFYVRFTNVYPTFTLPDKTVAKNLTGSEFVVFNTSTKTIYNYKLSAKNGNGSQVLQNAGIEQMSLTGPYSGWMRLYCSMNKDSNDKYLANIDFGPTSGTLAYTTGSPKQGGVNYFYNITNNFSAQKKSCYIWGAKLECIARKPTEYIETNGNAYFHRHLNLDAGENLALSYDGFQKPVLKIKSNNASQRFEKTYDELAFGTKQYVTGPKQNYSNNQNFVTWNLWNEACDPEFDPKVYYLRKKVTAPFNFPAKYNFYPRKYNDYILENDFFPDPLFAWWSFNPDDGGIIHDLHTGNNDLTVSGGVLYEGSLQYKEQGVFNTTKIVGTVPIKFGGFPGTDGFAYG